MSLFKEPKIVFHHIPKCGGTSIVTGLAMTYYPMRLLTRGKKGFSARINAPESTKIAKQEGINRYTYRRQLLADQIEKDACPFVSGHYPFNHEIYEKFQNSWSFITLLRDPVARWYSEYFWNRYKDHEYLKTDLPMEAYLETPQGLENTRSFVNYFSASEEVSAPVTQQELQQALETLPKLKVIGCLEHMDRFRHDMKKEFGRKPYFFKANKSPAPKEKMSKPDRESDVHKKLLRLLEADIEIYQKAKESLGL